MQRMQMQWRQYVATEDAAEDEDATDAAEDAGAAEDAEGADAADAVATKGAGACNNSRGGSSRA